jgi:hypothetical protein
MNEEIGEKLKRLHKNTGNPQKPARRRVNKADGVRPEQ